MAGLFGDNGEPAAKPERKKQRTGRACSVCRGDGAADQLIEGVLVIICATCNKDDFRRKEALRRATELL